MSQISKNQGPQGLDAYNPLYKEGGTSDAPATRKAMFGGHDVQMAGQGKISWLLRKMYDSVAYFFGGNKQSDAFPMKLAPTNKKALDGYKSKGQADKDSNAIASSVSENKNNEMYVDLVESNSTDQTRAVKAWVPPKSRELDEPLLPSEAKKQRENKNSSSFRNVSNVNQIDGGNETSATDNALDTSIDRSRSNSNDSTDSTADPDGTWKDVEDSSNDDKDLSKKNSIVS